MTREDEMWLVAVYESDSQAHDAVRALEQAGVAPTQVRIDDARDHLAAVRGEMRSETIDAYAGPGNGPFTPEMARGLVLGVVVGGIIGMVVALPFAAITFGSMAWWTRLITVAVVGIVVGATIGAIVAASFAARRPDEPLAAEAGATLAVPLSAEARAALVGSAAERIDIVGPDGHAITTVTTHHPGEREVVHDIAEHLRTENRRPR